MPFGVECGGSVPLKIGKSEGEATRMFAGGHFADMRGDIIIRLRP